MANTEDIVIRFGQLFMVAFNLGYGLYLDRHASFGWSAFCIAFGLFFAFWWKVWR